MILTLELKLRLPFSDLKQEKKPKRKPKKIMDTSSIKIIMIAALSQNRVIGRQGELPWHIPADLRHFKQTTRGYPVVMGRKTFESLGRCLPGRENVVITRSLESSAEVQKMKQAGARVFSTVVEAVAYTKAFASQYEKDKIFIIGGGEIYSQCLTIADELCLTQIEGVVEGDAYFPDFSLNDWELVSVTPCSIAHEEQSTHTSQVFVYKKKK
jgi:dihydrofolate reductase